MCSARILCVSTKERACGDFKTANEEEINLELLKKFKPDQSRADRDRFR